MLTRLRLQNFRCFQDHSLPLRELTIMVGRNNAGKSTIIEALRLVSLIVNRYHGLHLSNAPDWTGLPRRLRGMRPSLEGMGFDFETAFHGYDPPPAIITAQFDTKHSVRVYVGPDDEVFGVILDSNERVLSDTQAVRRVELQPMNVMPPIGPLAREEKILTPQHVNANRATHLAPRHFRNQLNLEGNAFRSFSDMAENTWLGLQIREFQGRGHMPGTQLRLMIREGGFIAEVGAMGHGLQMWLQIVWFLAHASSQASVVLDEPDIYMHADLQRRLIRLLKQRYNPRQLIIATHSVEIMSEVDPEEVLIVDHSSPTSQFAASLPGMQNAVNLLGAAHNIQLARLWNAKRYLLVEGEDIGILRYFQNRLFPDTRDPLQGMPSVSVGGWDGWNYAVGSSMLLKNAGGEDVVPYCILDSDYHQPDEIEKRRRNAASRGVRLHIWARKEIENYLLNPSAIQRVIASQLGPGVVPPSVRTVEDKIFEIAEELRADVLRGIMDELHRLDDKRKWMPSKVHQEAESILERLWADPLERLARIPGENAMRKLNQWSQATFGVSFSNGRIAQELRSDELPDEIADVVTAIEECIPFAGSTETTLDQLAENGS